MSDRDDGERLELSGEIDLANARAVGARLGEHLAGDGDVVVDAGELSFIDIDGCRELVEAARRLGGGRRLRVVRAPAVLVRTLSVCEWRDSPHLVVVPEQPGGSAT